MLASRLLAGALGCLMLAAGLLKAADLGLFVVQIKSYGIVSDPLLVTALAFALLLVECGLGAALLLYYRPRWSLFGVSLLLLIFIGATAWTWQKGGTEDCGCFGALVQRTPGQALVEDLVFFAAGALAFFLGRKVPNKPSPTRRWLVIAACLTGLLLPLALGFPLPHVLTPQNGSMPLGDLHLTGEPRMDLYRGTYLIAVMDTDCSHCQAAVPFLNSVAADGNLAMVAGICTNSAEDMDYFIARFGPQYPVYSVPENEFWRLAGSEPPPRYLLVKNGSVIKTWSQQPPPLSELKK
ncbi:MAG: MauE/DoxX family redox-associated membrane protein [Thermodesulfobacteriota bacterium]